jgi:ATP-dependent helicase/nuclease subunit A
MDEASLRQRSAADPTLSTWLAANAGSGKTSVLTDRVARLLLRGADPARILCLTYTRAAAAEMQNRLFRRLGEWTMLEDVALAARLAALDEPVTDPEGLARARRLFARALDTPGGLKIQTIHAFCATILRRFPLEAGVAPDFAEADERGLARLRDALLDRFAEGPEAGALAALLDAVGEGKLAKLLGELDAIDSGLLDDPPDPGALFDLPRGFNRAALEGAVFEGDEGDLLALVPDLLAGGQNDRKLGRALAQLAAPSATILPALEGALLHGAEARKAGPFTSKAGKIPTQPVRRATDPDRLALLDALADRVAEARPLRIALAAADGARAVLGFARLWVPALAAAKAAQGWLAFDDLVARARALLADPAVAQWVLWKLDGGIDHILVDEAQDTAPAQWQIVERLVAELTAGREGRTLFVVGDRKQSIYSFQGADLRGFEAVRGRLGAALAGQGRALVPMELLHSFRAAPPLLRLVDACFDTAPGGLGEAPAHLAFHEGAPGRVDLWPVPVAPAAEEPGAWHDPVDRPAATHPDLQLAAAIAAEIRRLIDAGTAIPTRKGVERLHEGHVLILVRRRKGLLFDALIQACKAQGLAMAGADRLALLTEPAVIDVLALLRALALPEDDLSLATALRSALFGWSEARLFDLAAGRDGLPLVARLRDDPGAEEVRAVFDDLRDATDFLRPHELLERLLTRHDGRRRLVARFGPEADEPLEALVELALAYETEEVPTLDGFLAWLSASEAELRRQVEGAGHRLRVMTVHGAKGLEAPLVILPDCADRADADRAILAWLAGLPVPRARASQGTEAQAVADAAEAQLRADERDRLLYVALTRAERWLIVGASGKVDQPGGWYGRVAAAMERLGALPHPTPLGEGRRLAAGDWPASAAAVAAPAAPVVPPALVLPEVRRSPALLAPSGLGGPSALGGPEAAEGEVARAYGRLVHALLENLPGTPDPQALSARLARPHAATLGPDLVARARAEAAAVLADPALAALCAPDVAAEVALSGVWQGRPVLGVIDRLMIAPDRVLAVDFKTNRNPPERPEDIPEGLLRQMGAYAHLLAALHPGARIETALLWTAIPRLMPVPPGLAEAALARAVAEGVIAAQA